MTKRNKSADNFSVRSRQKEIVIGVQHIHPHSKKFNARREVRKASPIEFALRSPGIPGSAPLPATALIHNLNGLMCKAVDKK